MVLDLGNDPLTVDRTLGRVHVENDVLRVVGKFSLGDQLPVHRHREGDISSAFFDGSLYLFLC